MQKELTIYLIAGEASGDALGAKLMKALRSHYDNYIQFEGLGGEHMIGQGLVSIFPMSEISLMGWAEIIPHLPQLLRRIKETTEDIKQKKPDVVVTIDSPGFNFRIARELQGSGIKLVHYVAPSVWAYKPERARKVASLYNHLLMLLPFEPPYFDAVGLNNTFVGHPIIEEEIAKGNASHFRDHHHIPKDATVLCVMPGSRKTETKKMVPVFTKAIKLLAKKHPDLYVVIPTISSMQPVIAEFAKKLPVKTITVTGVKEKYDAYAASEAALVKSGTGAVEVSIAGVPLVVAYKTGRISARMARKMLQISRFNLINILLNKSVIPELIQENCTPEKIAGEVEKLLSDNKAAKSQVQEAKKALKLIGMDQTPTPSEKAATAILGVIEK